MTIYVVETVFWLLAAGLWWMFYGPFRKYQCDTTRYRLFVIRDELFDIAAQGTHVKFDDRAYGMARTTLNGMLRNVEDFNVVRLFFLLRRASYDDHWRSMRNQHSQEFENAINELPPEGRESINKAMKDAHSVMVVCMLRRSLMLLVLRQVGKILQPIEASISRFLERTRQVSDMSYDFNIAGHDKIKIGAGT